MMNFPGANGWFLIAIRNSLAANANSTFDIRNFAGAGTKTVPAIAKFTGAVS